MNKIIIGLIGIVFSLSASEIYATFNVEATKSASLAFDAGGIVKKVNVDIAFEVKKGELLALLVNGDKKANLDNALSNLKYAKKDYDRQLKVKSLIDESKFDLYAHKYENAKNMAAYQEAVYNKTFLRAPFDGVIFYKDIELGDTVSGMTLKTVYKIQSKNSRKLVLEFDSKYSSVVRLGDEFVYFVDGIKEQMSAKITKVYPNANSKTRKMSAEILTKDLMPGLFGHGIIKAK